ncbi:DUF413 domain-containing protein [Aliikangiella sp. IMCC44653]
MQTREYWLSKRFADFRRYPYGFSRSGDFTIRQSQLLEQNGVFIQALLNGEVSNPTSDDQELLQALLNSQKEYSEIASIWIKYRQINHIKISVSASAREAASDEDEELAVDIEDWDD